MTSQLYISVKTAFLLICFQLLFNSGFGFSIIITEIMSDPSPARGLPEVEWIELTNISATPQNVGGYRIAKASSLSGPLPSIMLEPGQQLIICSTGSLSLMQVFGKAVFVTSFPSLGNSGDLLVLRGAQGQTLHAIEYNDSWYRNDLKKNGGWSLEMTNTNLACIGKDNWQATMDDKGGTPGKPNTLVTNIINVYAPRLLHVFPIDSIHLRCVFDQSVDSLQSFQPTLFNINNGIGQPSSILVTPPMFREVVLTLPKALVRKKLYEVSCKDILNCSGKAGPVQMCITGLPDVIRKGEIIINEFMTDPVPGSADYVELYNVSAYPVDLNDLHLANRNDAGQVSNTADLQTGHRLLLPGGYAVLTEDTAAIRYYYHLEDNFQALDNLFQLNDLPSYPDDKGTILLTDQQGNLIDEVPYLDDWHHPLLTNTEGVSLERIAPSMPSAFASTWHSASSLSNYGTPGYRNSQSGTVADAGKEVSVLPSAISPDNDGRDDYVTISFNLETPGTIMYLQVYTLGGTLVKKPDHLQLNGRTGSFSWDGLGTGGKKLPAGIYILCVNWQDLHGHTFVRKFPVVIKET